jgi:hypothetical protein
MAFAKPLIVLGIGGFSRGCDETSIDYFLDEGFYGVGDGTPAPLGDQIAALLDADRRRALGAWSRRVIEDQFALTSAADTLESLYAEAAARPATRPVGSVLRTGAHRLAADLAGDRVRARVRPLARAVLARGAS